MKLYEGGNPKLSIEQREELADNQSIVDSMMIVLLSCVERQEKALSTAQMAHEGDLIPLAIKRAQLEGARCLVLDAKAAFAKNNRS